jgi:DNA helicase II / ATP-dependent DNA helicase PcrA
MLNPKQKEAVEFGNGPLLIIAGAGTGKTTVVTERIKWLISSEMAKPSEILALTFTEKAAKEMEERVDKVMPYGYTQMWVMTFHAFCDRILKAEALNIGLDPNMNLLTGAEMIQLIRKNLFNLNLNYFKPLGNPNKFIDGLIAHFSRLKDEDVTPNQYDDLVKYQISNIKYQNEDEKAELEKSQELARAYKAYEDIKTKNSVMDFGDLITNTLKLFRTRPNILKKYQEQFKYLLVDEFQDTNFAQNELAILLSSKNQNITVCADDDQAIYRWRGAAISNVIQFKDRFPKAKIVSLTRNYRSTQEILDRAYDMIQNNNPDRLEVKEKIDKKLVADNGIRGDKIEFLYTDRVENEADLVAQKIAECKLQNTDCKYSDFAILVRANNHADPFIRALNRHNIPAQFLGPGMLFKQPEVKDLIAYLKFLADIEDSVAFYRVISMEIFKVNPRDLAIIGGLAKRENLTLFEAAEKYETLSLSDETKNSLKKILDMINKHLGLIKSDTAGQILYFFLEDTGILKNLTDYSSALEEKRAKNIAKFFDKLKNYEGQNEDASVFAVADWIDLSMELGESPMAADTDWTLNDAVNIMTLHSAKGLEFPYVFLINLVMQRFPTSERKEQIPIPDSLIKEILPEGDFHLEEERRLFYVGMTRAKEKLFLTAANYYGEGKRERKISPFVFEALGESASQQSSNLATSNEQQLSFLDFQKSPELVVANTQPLVPITYLSYSQIEAFDNCPQQYCFRYIKKIPTSPSGALIFGDSIHKTMQVFYQSVKNGEKPEIKDLIKMLSDNWSSAGYSSKKHELEMKRKGEEILTAYFEKSYDPKNIPQDLEQKFTVKIDPNLKVGGKIDRVDLLKNGTMEIIDYKTGKVPAADKIDKSLQMTVYALAASDPGIYDKDLKNVVMSFYFFESQEKISTTRTKKQLELAKKELIGKKEEIEKSNFEPKPGNLCDFCEYRLLCEAWS